MDRSSRLDSLVAPLGAEVLAGAREVSRRASRVLADGAGGLEAESLAGFRARLSELCLRILDAQPAMAPLVTLAAEVLDAAEGAVDVPSARHAARDAAMAFGQALEARGRAAAGRAAALLPQDVVALTLSRSASVRDALILRAGTGRLEAWVLEGRPLLEGRLLAEDLAAGGIPVTLAVDAAAATLARRATAVLLGADSVGDLGVVNKLGSAALASAARRAGVPVLVCADGTKVLPPGFPQCVSDQRPGEEVLAPIPGVRAWNRYFEVVPLEDVTRVVTESGAFTPEELARHRALCHVPEELRAWAARRLRDHPEEGLR